MHHSGLNIEDSQFTAPLLFPRETELIKLVQRRIQSWKKGHNLPAFAALPTDSSGLKTIQRWQKKICRHSKQLIVFGIGGSSLGGDMLVNGLQTKAGLPVKFYDNVDPDTLTDLDKVNWKKTFLLVISKSGSTAETLSQFLTTLPNLRKCLGTNLDRHVAVITENQDSDLGKIARSLQIPIIKHPQVGGRFSALSIVGLLPAAVAGANIKKILGGASAMLQNCLLPNMKKNPALRGAAAQYFMAKDGKNISVYMSYGQKLDRVASWQSQLWGESLGKIDNNGEPQGLTPVAARGVTDQHSQLQLYLDGPANKQFTLFYDPIATKRGRKIGKKFKRLKSVKPLAGRTTGELFKAEFLGTRDALTNRQLPTRTFNMATGDSGAFGAMIILLELETVILAELLGVDAYDQPAVEDGKIRARAYLEKS
jgi:glucose-6-phosphate isomerase